jgi:hypothetical protein
MPQWLDRFAAPSRTVSACGFDAAFWRHDRVQADYAKASFEANKAYFEKFVTLKAPDAAVQLTTDHMKSAYETFTAEAKKIGEMYQTFFATFTPTSATISKALKVV